MEEEEPPAQPRRHRDRQTGGRSEGRWGNREMGRPDGVQPCVHQGEGRGGVVDENETNVAAQRKVGALLCCAVRRAPSPPSPCPCL